MGRHGREPKFEIPHFCKVWLGLQPPTKVIAVDTNLKAEQLERVYSLLATVLTWQLTQCFSIRRQITQFLRLSVLMSSLDHLQINNPLTDSEGANVRYVLHGVKETLDVQDRSEQLEDPNTVCRSARSSLRRIPPELLFHIFSQTLPDPPLDFEHEFWNTLDVTEEPWTLARVSSSWRAVALAHQGLWSNIRLNLEWLRMDGYPPPAPAILRCCLERSGNHALSIHFKESFNASIIKERELLLVLLSHSHRWMDVALSLSYPNLQRLAQIRERLPLLRFLDIYCYDTKKLGILNAFEVAPRLRAASLSVGDPQTLLLPWTQLTTLEGWKAPSMNLLRDASRVVDCSLSFDMSYAGDPSLPVVRNDSLRRLQINLERPLDGLEAPSLEDLHINNGNTQRASALRHVTSFLHRSSCSLQSLLLSCIPIEGESDLIPLLESAPSLVFLQVKFGAVNWTALVGALTVTRTRSLVPNLKTARFIMSKNDFLSPTPKPSSSELLDMIESRFPAVGKEGISRLEGITLLGLQKESPSRWPRLAKLVEQGLRVVDDTTSEEDIDTPPVVRWAWGDIF
ncbi:hypothetical protein Hypma_009899 [Hypsizygus marmoreus]|uniref:Uncharacterized protein n=1 Tax=Hypsizygus marmoreus TaxID=39966 RepID=A0A369JRB0_HYPMA|nr:hypothetical protein Hypma_009899 [Hypsizygus marmoreus]